MLHVFYRTCNKENNKRRPAFYTKRGCLKNFIHALTTIQSFSFLLVSDGSIDETSRSLVEPIGESVVLDNVGNSASLWYALCRASNLPAGDLVYFVEDDYLHVPDALEKLVECDQSIKADYVTLYDHPVRYMPDFEGGADLALPDTSVYVSDHHHWRQVESTCMTFATRSDVLKQDLPVFDVYVRQTSVPSDRELFRDLQGLIPSAISHPTKRRLVGPIPSLATHCEDPWLAPVVDWTQLAKTMQ